MTIKEAIEVLRKLDPKLQVTALAVSILDPPVPVLSKPDLQLPLDLQQNDAQACHS